MAKQRFCALRVVLGRSVGDFSKLDEKGRPGPSESARVGNLGARGVARLKPCPPWRGSYVYPLGPLRRWGLAPGPGDACVSSWVFVMPSQGIPGVVGTREPCGH